MKELKVAAGESSASAIKRLLKEAPAWCTFNGIRLEAKPGITENEIWYQLESEAQRRSKEFEEKEAAKAAQASKNWVLAIRRNERARIISRIRALPCPNAKEIADLVELEPVSEDGP